MRFCRRPRIPISWKSSAVSFRFPENYFFSSTDSIRHLHGTALLEMRIGISFVVYWIGDIESFSIHRPLAGRLMSLSLVNSCAIIARQELRMSIWPGNTRRGRIAFLTQSAWRQMQTNIFGAGCALHYAV